MTIDCVNFAFTMPQWLFISKYNESKKRNQGRVIAYRNLSSFHCWCYN
jgi:hypothetical protein